MKKYVLMMLLLAAMSAGAMAEWVEYAELDEMDIYIDPSTIKKNGNFRKAWEIQDLKQRHKEVMSRRILIEHDCNDERRRVISISGHTGHMASGETIYSNNSQSDWQYVAPNIVAASGLKIVCSK